jgi:hypothetical protein
VLDEKTERQLRHIVADGTTSFSKGFGSPHDGADTGKQDNEP